MALVRPTRTQNLRSVTFTWVLTTADTGEMADAGELEAERVFQVTGAGTAQRRRSLDGVTFANDGAAQAAGVVDILSSAKFYDINPVTVGSCVVTLHGVRRAV